MSEIFDPGGKRHIVTGVISAGFAAVGTIFAGYMFLVPVLEERIASIDTNHSSAINHLQETDRELKRVLESMEARIDASANSRADLRVVIAQLTVEVRKSAEAVTKLEAAIAQMRGSPQFREYRNR